MSTLRRKWLDKLLARLLTLLGFGSTFAFMACYAPPMEDLDYLEVNPTEIWFPSNGGEQAVLIDTEGKWVVSEEHYSERIFFFDVYPMMGNGPSYITVTTQANEEEEPRSGYLKISGRKSEISATVSVRQDAGNYYFRVMPDSIILSCEKGYKGRFTIETNKEWTITEVPSFVVVTPLTGIRSFDVTVKTTSENDSTAPRKGILNIQGERGKTAKIMVTQQHKQ